MNLEYVTSKYHYGKYQKPAKYMNKVHKRVIVFVFQEDKNDKKYILKFITENEIVSVKRT